MDAKPNIVPVQYPECQGGETRRCRTRSPVIGAAFAVYRTALGDTKIAARLREQRYLLSAAWRAVRGLKPSILPGSSGLSVAGLQAFILRECKTRPSERKLPPMPTGEEINQAIRECLDECYASSNPLLCLADFIQKLRQRPGWTAIDTGHVQQKALRILTILLEPPQVTPEPPQAQA